MFDFEISGIHLDEAKVINFLIKARLLVEASRN